MGLGPSLESAAKVTEYVPDPHPAYPYLHLAHRADYLRPGPWRLWGAVVRREIVAGCYLLHNYGGLYLDAGS